MNGNIKDFVRYVQEKSKSRRGEVQYAYVAGYYESVLADLARRIPEVDKYLKGQTS